MIHTPEYYAWRGLAFETLCLNHVDQIKGILGIQGVQSQEYSWRSRQSDPGAQIDLMINRRDDVINLCEMKFTTEPFSITPEFERQMIHKMETFRKETGSRKAIHLTLISAEGISAGGNRGSVTQIITGDDLFRT